MKLKIVFRSLLLCIFSTAIFSCSDDDSPEACHATEISMKINGELHTYSGNGWGIDLVAGGGHKLSLQFNRSLPDTFSNEYLLLVMPYKKTGNNVIDELTLSRFDDEHNGEYSLIGPDISSNVRINRSTCFYATFSGKFMADGEEMIVTDGIISWEYDEPFSE